MCDPPADRIQNESAIGFLSFALRTNGGPDALVPAVREAIIAIDPNIGIDAIAPLTDLEADAVARERFYAVMLGVFAPSPPSSRLSASTASSPTPWRSERRKSVCAWRSALSGGQVLALILRRGTRAHGDRPDDGPDRRRGGSARAASRCCSGSIRSIPELSWPSQWRLLSRLWPRRICPARRATKVDPDCGIAGRVIGIRDQGSGIRVVS